MPEAVRSSAGPVAGACAPATAAEIVGVTRVEGGAVPAGRPAAAGWPSVDGYEVLGELGRGATGVVYKARHLRLDRVVALKMILTGAHASVLDLERFRLEAVAAAQLQHPNIVPVYEVGEHEGLPFFAREWVDGGTLSARSGGTPQPPRQAAQLVQTLAGAMECAHRQGIIHRDLKPGNVLLDQAHGLQPAGFGIPKVTDFGLAKRLEAADSRTRTGTILGTPSYMAPEQATGQLKKLGPAADVYALGAILYELLTGGPPFRGETVLDTLQQVKSADPVPPSRLRPKLPHDLETICLKCLEKEPARRYPTAQELADDLRRFLDGDSIRARPAAVWERGWKWSRRRPTAAALAVVAVFAVAGVVVGGLHQARQERQRADAAEALRREAEDERERAEENFRLAREAVHEMLTRVGQERLAREPRLEPLRRELLEEALRFHERFLLVRGNDTVLSLEAARAWLRAADVRALLGDHEAAARAYRLALDRFAALTKAEPGRPGHRRDLAAAHNNFGNLLRDLGRLLEAETNHREAMALRERLVTASGEDPALRRELAVSLHNLALVLRARGELLDAEEACQKALEQHRHAGPGLERAGSLVLHGEVLQALGQEADAVAAFRGALDDLTRLRSDRPDDPDLRHEFVAAHNHLGNLFRDVRQHEANQHYREAVRLGRDLTADFPSVPLYRQQLAASCNNLGILLQAAGKRDEADQAFADALSAKGKLAADFPCVPGYRRDLAGSLNNRGLALHTQHRHAEAEVVYRRAVGLSGRLAEEFPDEPEYEREEARARLNLGALLLAAGRADEAEDEYGRALDVLTRLTGRLADQPDCRQEMARLHLNRGALSQVQGKPADAERAYREAVRLFAELRRDYPGVPDHPHQAGVALNNLGSLLRAAGRTEEAEQPWQEGCGLLEQLRLEFPDVPVYRQDLARGYNEWAIALAARDARRGEDLWRRAVALQQELLNRRPAEPAYRLELARSHGNLGLLLARTKRFDEAESSYRRAVTLLEDLVAGPHRSSVLADLVVHATNLADLLATTEREEEASRVRGRVAGWQGVPGGPLRK